MSVFASPVLLAGISGLLVLSGLSTQAAVARRRLRGLLRFDDGRSFRTTRAHDSRSRSTLVLHNALPSTVDMLAIVLGSGGTIARAVAVVARSGDPAVRPSFDAVRSAQEGGLSLVDALHTLVDALGETYRPVVRALVATERDGAPIATLLLRLSEEAETARRFNADARARRLSVHLLIPLVTCMLPAVFVGAVVPLVAVAVGQFVR